MRYFLCSFDILMFARVQMITGYRKKKREENNTKNMLSKQLNHDHHNLFYFLCLFVAFLYVTQHDPM